MVVKRAKYIPDRGDVIWLEFDPQAGNEIKKNRPALVISPREYNERAHLAIVMPITSQIKGYPFEEGIIYSKIQGVILCDQIRSLDWSARNAKYICTISEKLLFEVIEKFKVLIE